MATKDKISTLRISAELDKKLRQIANREDRPVASVIRRILESAVREK